MRLKLNSGFLTIILLLWTICICTIWNTTSEREIFNEVNDDIVPGAIAMKQMKYEVTEIKMWTTCYIIRGNEVRENIKTKDKLRKKWSDLEKDAKQHLEHERHFSSDSSVAEKILKLSQKIISVSADVVDLKDRGTGNEELFDVMDKRFKPLFMPLRKFLDEHTAVHVEEWTTANSKTRIKQDANIKYAVILGVIATILAVFVGFIVDRLFVRYVAERNRAEDALSESEEKYRFLVQYANDIIYKTDFNGYFTFYNKSMTSVTGYSEKDFKGMNYLELIHTDYKEEVDRFYRLQFKNKTSSTYNEVPLVTKDGKQIWIGQNSQLIIEGNKIIGFHAVARDITKLKQMEEEALKAKKLESLGKLAGGIAHDFNNLLTSITGNISLAQMELDPESTAFGLLKEAEKASMRTKDLTVRLITFSRGGEPVKKVTSIGDLVNDSVSSMLSDFSIGCEISIPDDIRSAKIDEQQMKQVIHNIITNAVEAMTGKGTIKVYCENVTVGEEDALTLKKGEYVKISIKDQGPGISEENLTRIFDPYFSTKEMGAEKGMGLGLSVCHSIVEKHNGLITAESGSGVGTTFFIYLPATTAKRPIETGFKRAGQAPDAKRLEVDSQSSIVNSQYSIKRVLVMDDEEMIRKLSIHMLSRLGYNAEVSVDGAEAVELYKKAKKSGEPFDAVILDLTNDLGMGGREAVQRLLEIDSNVKAIISSGYSNNPIMSNPGAYGFKGVLSKPYTSNELSIVLNEVMKD